jgi:hypothetical protein
MVMKTKTEVENHENGLHHGYEDQNDGRNP